MTASFRVLINTTAQYVRTVFSVIITLYTSRVILSNLGIEDYGIYSLVGGVIALLAFIQSDLAKTIQRFLSYNHGRDNQQMLIQIFNNSVCTQLMISSALFGVLLALTPFIFNYLLNISPEKIYAAKIVYWISLVSLFFDMQCTPYLAVLISRENIVFTSLVSIFDTLLKLPVALSLIYISTHKLEWFTFLTASVVVLNYLIYIKYCLHKYEECRHFRFSSFQKKLFIEMFSFMGWNVYGTMCVVTRTQGIAILLNRFFSTMVNAAYGIGGQVSGQISFLSSALTTAINPQIIKAEGGGNRQKMLRLAEISCKYSFLLMSIIAIPSIIYMDTLIHLWLVEVPEYAVMFCCMIVLSVLIDITTLNLNSANQAIGNVKIYSLCVNSIKIMTLPIAWLVLINGFSPLGVMLVYVAIEFICALSRLVFLKINIGLSINSYIKNVLICIISVSSVNFLLCYYVSRFLTGWLFVLTFLISAIITLSMTFLIKLNEDEKNAFGEIYNKIKERML